MLLQGIEIPDRLFRDPIVRDNNRTFFRCAQARNRDGRHLGHAQAPCGLEPAVAR